MVSFKSITQSQGNQADSAPAVTGAVSQESSVDSMFDIVMKQIRIPQKLLSSFKSELSTDQKLIPIINKFDALKKELVWFGIILSAIQLSIMLYMLFYHSAFRKEKNKVNLGMQIAMLALGLPLAVLGIITTFGILASAAPILLIVSTAKGLFEKVWDVGVSLFERFTGDGRKDQQSINGLKLELKNQLVNGNSADSDKLKQLTTLVNKQQERNAKIADTTHSLILCAVASVGSLLLLTPAMPIGAAILAAASVYGVMHVLGYNPFKLLGKGINFLSKVFTGKPVINLNPFAHKKEQTILAELKNENHQDKNKIKYTATSDYKKIPGTLAQLKPLINQFSAFYAKNAASAGKRPAAPKQQPASNKQIVVMQTQKVSDFSLFKKQHQASTSTSHPAIDILQDNHLRIAASPAA